MIRPLLALTLKDLRLLSRDKGALFFTIGFPLIFGLFFGFIFSGSSSGPSTLNVALVDQDQSEASESLVRQLSLNEALDLTESDSAIEAADHVRLGRAHAFIRVPKGFGKQLDLFLTGDTSTIELITDPGRPTAAAVIEGMLMSASFQVIGELIADPSNMREQVQAARIALSNDKSSTADSFLLNAVLTSLDALLADLETEAQVSTSSTNADAPTNSFEMPIQVRRTPLSSGDETNQRVQPSSVFAITFAQAMVWAMIGCCASFSSSMSDERILGTLVRLRLSSLSMPMLLLGKALACYVGSLVVAVGFLILSIVGFSVTPVNWGNLIIALALSCLAFSGLMLLISALARSRSSPSQMAWGFMLILALIGGGMLPLEFMPDWLLVLSDISPVKWAILAIEGGIWRDFTPAELLLPSVILLGISVLGFGIGVAALKKVPLSV